MDKYTLYTLFFNGRVYATTDVTVIVEFCKLFGEFGNFREMGTVSKPHSSIELKNGFSDTCKEGQVINLISERTYNLLTL